MTKPEALKIACRWIEAAFPHPDLTKLTDCWRLYCAIFQGVHIEKARSFLAGLPDQKDVIGLREYLGGDAPNV